MLVKGLVVAHYSSSIGLDTKYDQFLQMPVGDDSKGTSVTVLSMLARLGLDPWQEASDLAALPRKSAWERLDGLVARFTDVPSLIAKRADAVSRMIASLPGGELADRTRRANAGAGTGTILPDILGNRLYLMVAIAFLVIQVAVFWFGK
ncbi:hypothetical protein [Thalassospira xiamenensis]|uniref:hypothetical protein n=1 Tax=Thalassospira xiamenensis TaxID=220697 RepID=UPI003AA8A3F9